MDARSLADGTVHTLPADFRNAIAHDATAAGLWADITPLARNEWICWVTSAKQEATRKRRIEVGIDKMRGGMPEHSQHDRRHDLAATSGSCAASSRSIYVFQLQLNSCHGVGKKAAIFRGPTRRRIGMILTKQHLVMVRTLGVAIVALGLASCATYDDDFARINTRLDQLDTRVQSAAQSAEAANQSAQQANQRLDQMESRVQQLETAPRRRPRG